MGTWTQIEDIHVFFFEEEPLVALPTEDNAAVAVTKWHQVKQEGIARYAPAARVPEGSYIPPAPRLVFDLVTHGDLPITCSEWILASALPDEDQHLTEPCLPVDTIWVYSRKFGRPHQMISCYKNADSIRAS